MANPCADLLNRNLAAAIDLHARAKHAHWNVTGPAFIGVHKLFDKIAGDADDWADTMAERARYLGVEAPGTAKTAALSFLGPYTVGIAGTQVHLAAINRSLETFCGSTRSAIASCLGLKDQASADVFIEITRAADKDTYLVRSHLE